MRLLTLDIESFYSQEYSLRKMTVPEYILDTRWEIICVGVKLDDGPIEVIDGPDFPAWLATIDPAQTIMLNYNSLYDACVIAWRYGFVPVRLVDVMGLVRCLRGHLLKGVSLETVAAHFHLQAKGHTIAQVKGMRRAQIMGQPVLWKAFKEYCAHDVELTWQIFNLLAPEMPRTEFRVMDLVLRCAVTPVFHADIPLLERHLQEVAAEKERLLVEAGADKGDLMSTEKFKQLLVARGIEIEYKPSPSNPEIMNPCFAKTDQFMTDLLENDDTVVQALAAARLGVRSTIEESRCQRLLSIAGLKWPT